MESIWQSITDSYDTAILSPQHGIILTFLAIGGVKGKLLVKLSSAYRRQKDACTVMRRLIKSTPGQILDIPVNVCSVQINLRKPIRSLKVWWPVIRMEDWARWMLNNKPQLLLGGNDLDHKGLWKEHFYRFWELYRKIDGSHPVFQRPDFDLGCCIPYFFHGDEGRGQLRRPYMVISWQCAISHLGPQVTNDTSYPGDNGTIFCLQDFC